MITIQPTVPREFQKPQVLATTSTPNTSSYGTCWKCGDKIAIPGLTANYCPTCGWIVNRSKQQKGLGQ